MNIAIIIVMTENQIISPLRIHVEITNGEYFWLDYSIANFIWQLILLLRQTLILRPGSIHKLNYIFSKTANIH
jgi:hypothetical protein